MRLTSRQVWLGATLAVSMASHCLAMLSQVGDGVMQTSMTVAPGFEAASELYGDDNSRAMLQRPTMGDHVAVGCMLEAAPSRTATSADLALIVQPTICGPPSISPALATHTSPPAFEPPAVADTQAYLQVFRT
jgi:hypothetical protein